MRSVEEILLQKAAADEQNRQALGGLMTGGGAISGAALGMLSGRGLKGRMAGGLFGTILGGGLGLAAKEAALNTSPAAGLLAKLQVDGALSSGDELRLKALLTDHYNNQLGGL